MWVLAYDRFFRLANEIHPGIAAVVTLVIILSLAALRLKSLKTKQQE